MKFWKNIKKGLVVAAATLAFTSLAGSVSTKAAADTKELTTLNLDTQKATYSSKFYLAKGAKLRLTLKVGGLNVTSKADWTSSKTKYATVTSKGVVKGRAKGRTVISATYNGKTLKALVIVQAPKLSKTKLTLTAGNSKTIKLKGNSQEVTWTSKNPAVATVNSKGKITAVSAGKTKIYAKIEGKKYACTVTVKAATPTVSESTKSAYTTVKEYISKYGGLNANYDRLINYTLLDKSRNTHTWAIVYDDATNKLNFIYTWVNAAGTEKYALTTDIDCTASSYITPIIYMTNESSQSGFHTQAKIQASTYTKSSTVTFSIVESFGNTYNSSDIQTHSNTALYNAFLGWNNYLLKAKLNLSMKDLGFISYN